MVEFISPNLERLAIMVIVIGNRIGYLSLDKIVCVSLLANALWKGMNLSVLFPSYG